MALLRMLLPEPFSLAMALEDGAGDRFAYIVPPAAWDAARRTRAGRRAPPPRRVRPAIPAGERGGPGGLRPPGTHRGMSPFAVSSRLPPWPLTSVPGPGNIVLFPGAAMSRAGPKPRESSGNELDGGDRGPRSPASIGPFPFADPHPPWQRLMPAQDPEYAVEAMDDAVRELTTIYGDAKAYPDPKFAAQFQREIREASDSLDQELCRRPHRDILATIRRTARFTTSSGNASSSRTRLATSTARSSSSATNGIRASPISRRRAEGSRSPLRNLPGHRNNPRIQSESASFSGGSGGRE